MTTINADDRVLIGHALEFAARKYFEMVQENRSRYPMEGPHTAALETLEAQADKIMALSVMFSNTSGEIHVQRSDD